MFVRVRGVLHVCSGYANGHVPNPTYEQVCTGETGHNEVVRVAYDPAQVNLRQLLEIFMATHDPTTPNRQGNDVGTQYRSGIYFTTPEQQTQAQALIDELAREAVYARPIVTEVLPLTNYHPAEEYHQDFFVRNPHQGYCLAVAAPKVAKLRQTFARLAR